MPTDSAALRVSAASRRALSCSACASASLTMRSMSSLEREVPPVMVMDCSSPVPLSFAETCTMPLASMSKVTSICGHAAGCGGDAGQLEGTQRACCRERTRAHPGRPE